MFLINTPAIDYLTLTTYSTRVFDYWVNNFTNDGDWLDPKNDSKFEQYPGIKLDRDIGSLFIGEGKQKERPHHLLYVTSHLSEVLSRSLIDMTRPLRQAEKTGEFSLNCSRIDIQCTVPSPDNWSQWDLQERLHDKGYLVWSVPSMSKKREFRTVYIGAKGSDRLMRIYQKVDDKDKLFLRFEAQYRNHKKGGYAFQAFKTVRREGDIGKSGILHNELLNLKDSHLTDVFGPSIASTSDDPIKLKREYTRGMSTRNWFMSQVMPALARYLEESPFDAELTDAFARLLFPPPEE